MHIQLQMRWLLAILAKGTCALSVLSFEITPKMHTYSSKSTLLWLMIIYYILVVTSCLYC